MRRDNTKKCDSDASVRVCFKPSPGVQEQVDLSAKQNCLSRSAEINRLILLAFEKGLSSRLREPATSISIWPEEDTMRRSLPEKQGGRDTLPATFITSGDLVELIELSAEHNGLSRSAEVNRLLLIALEKRASDFESETPEIKGYVV